MIKDAFWGMLGRLCHESSTLLLPTHVIDAVATYSLRAFFNTVTGRHFGCPAKNGCSQMNQYCFDILD